MGENTETSTELEDTVAGGDGDDAVNEGGDDGEGEAGE